ncbi:hypothetical protein SBBP2_1270019 [Burkholderiales bacterium]|nr:hypothetical protein SBBP2_1270019 [Burkholderiales bacterium]
MHEVNDQTKDHERICLEVQRSWLRDPPRQKMPAAFSQKRSRKSILRISRTWTFRRS